MSHTPTPWHARRRPSKGNLVVECDWVIESKSRMWVAETNDQTDADFIVQAVNNHAALVEALDLATKELNAIRARSSAPSVVSKFCTEEWWDELTEKCYAALAAVKGEEEGRKNGRGSRDEREDEA